MKTFLIILAAIFTIYFSPSRYRFLAGEDSRGPFISDAVTGRSARLDDYRNARWAADLLNEDPEHANEWEWS